MQLRYPLIVAAAVLALGAPQVHALSLDERIILVAPDGTGKDDRAIAGWQQRAKAMPGSADNYERLGWAYIAKARRTLDAGYYKLAEKTADVMAARFGAGTSELLLRGHVLDNLHRFHEAEAVARKLVATRGEASDYALLSDALMEQGRVDDAVTACQQEMNLRPGLEAYGRAAHLRWLTGDVAGARAMMETAVRASSPVDATNCAWVVSRLSGYELQAGATAHALALAQAALKVAPGYPPALLAEGKALAAAGQMTEAARVLAKAAELSPIPEYQWWAVDTLRAARRGEDAAKVEQTLLQTGAAGDPRTFALYLATRGEEAAEAVRLAKAELENRADPLTYDALAWSEFAQGDVGGAAAAMAHAETRHTRDARLALHAACIAEARGDAAVAARELTIAEADSGTLTPSERSLLSAKVDALARAKASNPDGKTPLEPAAPGIGQSGGAGVRAVLEPQPAVMLAGRVGALPVTPKARAAKLASSIAPGARRRPASIPGRGAEAPESSTPSAGSNGTARARVGPQAPAS